MNIKVIPQTTNKHNIIKFQAWADSHVNFPYHERAPLIPNNIFFIFYPVLAAIFYHHTNECRHSFGRALDWGLQGY